MKLLKQKRALCACGFLCVSVGMEMAGRGLQGRWDLPREPFYSASGYHGKMRRTGKDRKENKSTRAGGGGSRL